MIMVEKEITITRELAEHIIYSYARRAEVYEIRVTRELRRFGFQEFESWDELSEQLSKLTNEQIETLLLLIK